MQECKGGSFEGIQLLSEAADGCEADRKAVRDHEATHS